MRISLFNIWNESMLAEQKKLLPAKPKNYSDNVMQSSFEFKANLNIVFVADKLSMSPVTHYNQLPEVTLTKEESEIAYFISQEISKKPNGYDGLHFLVSDIIYDDVENKLYIEAKKTKYSVLCGLNGKFPKDSPVMQQNLYNIGVLVPLITNDGNTLLLQASNYDKKNYATVKGFVEPRSSHSRLSHLVEKAAKQELMEELLADSQGNARVAIKNELNVSCLSFRKPVNGRGFVEFYVPACLDTDIQYLQHIVKTNQAPDRHEHTGEVQVFDLESNNRSNFYQQWAAQTPGGKDQYPLVMAQASRFYNKGFYGDETQQVMPESRQKSYPIAFFKPHVLITVSSKSNENEFQQEMGLK